MNLFEKIFGLLKKSKNVKQTIEEKSFQELVENAEFATPTTIENEDAIIEVDDSNYQSEEGEYDD